MTDLTAPGPVADYLHLIEARSLDAAADLVLRNLEAAHSPQQVIRTLLAPAQLEVGERWHRGVWTVADEHQATAVTDMALHRLAAAAQPRVHRAALAVVCAQGDWHTLPSRMAAELLRLDGWEVVFLGGSLPAPDLARWLREARPDGVVISCSIPTFASGVRSIGTIATQLGIPAVAGGRGLGRDGKGAAAIGVRWAKDLGDVGAALSAPWSPIDHDRIGQRQASSFTIALRRAEIVDAAMVELASLWSPMQNLDQRQLARTAEDFGHILDFVSATILLDDPRVFAEFLDWLTVLLGGFGIAPAVVRLGLDALHSAIPPELTAAHGVLAAASPSRSTAN